MCQCSVVKHVGPQEFWCVVDFEDNFIIVRKGKMYPLRPGRLAGDTIADDYIVPMKYELGKRAWEQYNDFQFTECPY